MPQGSLQQASLPGDAAKLPRLRPNVNRKAQEIIAAHMRSGCASSSVLSTATVHVLSKIDSTSTRKARSHDISHLLDGAPCLAPRIPPSLIAKEDHVYEKRFLPDQDSGSTYNEQDGMWYAKVFPSDKPSSRTDAVMLDAWITRSLERYAYLNSGDGKEDLAKTVEVLVPILSVGLHEIARQVTHHCAERGLALEKIWRTYVELFDRVLKQMRESLREQRRKTADTQTVLREVKAQLKEVRRRHPEDMQNAIKDLGSEFTQRQQDSEQELQKANEENAQLQQELKSHRTELDIWFPGFSFYQDSYIKNGLPQRNIPRPHAHHGPAADASGEGGAAASRQGSKVGGCNGEDGEVTLEAAEVAFAEDLKRLLAVLAPDKRRMIGQELAFIMESNDVASPAGRSGRQHGQRTRTSLSSRQNTQAVAGGEEDEKAKLEAETLELLRADIRLQEERILVLREDISRVETGQVDEVEELLEAAVKRMRNQSEVDMNVGHMEEELGRLVLQAAIQEEKDGSASGGEDRD